MRIRKRRWRLLRGGWRPPNDELQAGTMPLFCFGAAYLLECLDETVKAAEDIRRTTELTTLAGITERVGSLPTQTTKQPRARSRRAVDTPRAAPARTWAGV